MIVSCALFCRRMTEADLGEHWLQIIVRDLGSPSLETTQVLRLEVDRSPSSRLAVNNHDYGMDQFQYLGNANGRSDLGDSHKSWSSTSRGGSGNGGSHVSDVVLFVIISLMLATFLVIIGVCIYLRHRQKLFQCLPDLCDLFKRPDGNQYNSPDYVCRKPKGMNEERRGRPPLPPIDNNTLTSTGDFSNKTRSKCSSHIITNSVGNRFQIETPLSDCSDFLERPVRFTSYFYRLIPLHMT